MEGNGRLDLPALPAPATTSDEGAAADPKVGQKRPRGDSDANPGRNEIENEVHPVSPSID